MPHSRFITSLGKTDAGENGRRQVHQPQVHSRNDGPVSAEKDGLPTDAVLSWHSRLERVEPRIGALLHVVLIIALHERAHMICFARFRRIALLTRHST